MSGDTLFYDFIFDMLTLSDITDPEFYPSPNMYEWMS